MRVDLRSPIACGPIVDHRALELQTALNLSPSAAWVLAQMEADRSGIDAETMHYQSAAERLPVIRDQGQMKRLIGQIQSALGKDATLTENRIIALTPLGRLRLKKALGEVIL